jgi:acid phosphatase
VAVGTRGETADKPWGLLLSDNLSEIKEAIVAYHDSGRYEKDLESVDAIAEAYVIERSDKVKNPALVLDIDETSLSNWEQIVANDFAYFASAPCDKLPKGPCGSVAYDAMARARAILPTLKLARSAKEHHVAIFFITGRYEAERADTERNLRYVGYPDWVQLIMRPDGTQTPSAADYKRPQRERIAQMGYTIVANVGDQRSDLDGGFTERTFLLPDPFYLIR